jgi:hypothetical protein
MVVPFVVEVVEVEVVEVEVEELAGGVVLVDEVLAAVVTVLVGGDVPGGEVVLGRVKVVVEVMRDRLVCTGTARHTVALSGTQLDKLNVSKPSETGKVSASN